MCNDGKRNPSSRLLTTYREVPSRREERRVHYQPVIRFWGLQIERFVHSRWRINLPPSCFLQMRILDPDLARRRKRILEWLEPLTRDIPLPFIPTGCPQNRHPRYSPITYYWTVPLILDHSSRWEINKFENCWYKSVRILEVLKLLFHQFLSFSRS